MQMMWIHRPVAHKFSNTVLPGTAAGSPSCCLSPFLGRTQILSSAYFCADWSGKGNWGFASICMRIAAKIHYLLGLMTNIEHVLGWGRWESVEMRLYGSVFPVWHFFCVQMWLDFLIPASPAAAWIQMVQAKAFCLVHGQLITGNEWGRRESVSTEQVKKR